MANLGDMSPQLWGDSQEAPSTENRGATHKEDCHKFISLSKRPSKNPSKRLQRACIIKRVFVCLFSLLCLHRSQCRRARSMISSQPQKGPTRILTTSRHVDSDCEGRKRERERRSTSLKTSLITCAHTTFPGLFNPAKTDRSSK